MWVGGNDGRRSILAVISHLCYIYYVISTILYLLSTPSSLLLLLISTSFFSSPPPTLHSPSTPRSSYSFPYSSPPLSPFIISPLPPLLLSLSPSSSGMFGRQQPCHRSYPYPPHSSYSPLLVSYLLLLPSSSYPPSFFQVCLVVSNLAIAPGVIYCMALRLYSFGILLASAGIASGFYHLCDRFDECLNSVRTLTYPCVTAILT